MRSTDGIQLRYVLSDPSLHCRKQDKAEICLLQLITKIRHLSEKRASESTANGVIFFSFNTQCKNALLRLINVTLI